MKRLSPEKEGEVISQLRASRLVDWGQEKNLEQALKKSLLFPHISPNLSIKIQKSQREKGMNHSYGLWKTQPPLLRAGGGMLSELKALEWNLADL